MYTLFLRYTVDPNKSSDWLAYAQAELVPIAECGGHNIRYFAPTDFAGCTNEAFATIDVGSMAEYEVYRGKLAAHPKHRENYAKIQASGALHAIYRAILERVESVGANK